MKKLDDQLLDWFWAGDIVGRQWFVWLAVAMSYGTDLAALLAGLGIGGPLMSYIKGDTAAGKTFMDQLGAGTPLVIIGAAAAIGWGILRTVATHEEIGARAMQAREFANVMRIQWAALDVALRTPEPIRDVLKIQQIVDRKVQEAAASKKRVLPWHRLPPNDDPQRALAKSRMLDHIRRTHMANWLPLPDVEMREDV